MASTPPATIFERALYLGINLQDVLYGIELVLYFKTMHIFLARRRNPQGSDLFYAIFSSVMLLLVTIWVFTITSLGQKLWLLDRTYPGGPMAYIMGDASDIYIDFTEAVTIILQQMTDGLMLYRCRIVWGNPRVIIVPLLLWLATLVLGTVAAAMTGPNAFSGISAELSLAFFTSSVLLSTILTCMICYRLWRHARAVKEYLGEEFASPYFSVAMLLVESVLPYTLTGIVFLVLTGVRSQIGITFSLVYTLMMCISPQMLILRVAEGNAWQTDTIKASGSVVKFSNGSGATRTDGGRITVRHSDMLQSAYHAESVEGLDKV